MLKSEVLKLLIQLLAQLIAVAKPENTGITFQHHCFANIVLLLSWRSLSLVPSEPRPPTQW